MLNRLEHISTNHDVKMDIDDDSVNEGNPRNVTKVFRFKYRDSTLIININQVSLAYTAIRIMRELNIWTFDNFDSDLLITMIRFFSTDINDFMGGGSVVYQIETILQRINWSFL